MGIIFAYSKREKAKLKIIGKTLELLTLLVSLSKYLSEKIAKEKEISLAKAEEVVVDCIKDGMKTMQNENLRGDYYK